MVVIQDRVALLRTASNFFLKKSYVEHLPKSFFPCREDCKTVFFWGGEGDGTPYIKVIMDELGAFEPGEKIIACGAGVL